MLDSKHTIREKVRTSTVFADNLHVQGEWVCDGMSTLLSLACVFLCYEDVQLVR